ncbi:MAG: hypothetical protein WC521_05690 [Bdellovibrionales bacterium]|jgi:hypothetical protein
MSRTQNTNSSNSSSNDNKESGPSASASKEDSFHSAIKALHAEQEGLRSDEPSLNGLELSSVRALIDYVAYTHKLNEVVICSLVEDYFGTDDIQKIHRNDFDKAVAYLVDLNPRAIIN